MTKAVKQLVSKAKKSKMTKELPGSNAPDYENNLYFEPRMTWDDFIKYCHNNKIEGLIDHDIFGEFLIIDKFKFYKSGNVRLNNIIGTIAKNRTFEQYKEIIHNLYL